MGGFYDKRQAGIDKTRKEYDESLRKGRELYSKLMKEEKKFLSAGGLLNRYGETKHHEDGYNFMELIK